MPTFGQLVIGPPGSGKTTYCKVMSEFMQSIGRNVIIVNMDPANENITYNCHVNIRELINLEDVMDNCDLGPNGGLIYACEYVEKNFDWLKSKLDEILAQKKYKNGYIIFDFPGQIELYTHDKSIRNIIEMLVKLDYRLCTVNLVDSYYCTDASKFISVLLTTLSSMLHIEMPHINLLSKMDLIEQYGKLDFNLDYYTEVLDLNYLLEQLSDDPLFTKFKKLNSLICDVVQDFSLVSYHPLNIQKKDNLINIMQKIDQANGYLYGGLDEYGLRECVSNTGDYEYEDDE